MALRNNGPKAFREAYLPSSGPRGYLSPTAGASFGSSGVAGAGQYEEDGTTNSLVELWPRDRGLRGENGGEKALGGSG
jgi:hypothetical protein